MHDHGRPGRWLRKARKLKRVPMRFFRDFFDNRIASPPPSPDLNPAAEAQSAGRWPPGHYYSPIPSLHDIEARSAQVWAPAPDGLPGIDLNLDGQLAWIERLRDLRPEFPAYGPRPIAGHRYYTDNGMYGVGDALALYTMMRALRPRRILEAGSGFSSALMLDVNERFLGSELELTFIDPEPARLRRLLRDDDTTRATVHARPLQEVIAPLAAELEARDILLIDSSHVLKTGSDVNYLLFEVLPALREGVYVHFHDIPYPFEYPRRWVMEGRAWNEAYALRAFLMYNPAFRIELFISALKALERAAVHDIPGGSYLWLRKLAD